jgi:hypothetical protein
MGISVGGSNRGIFVEMNVVPLIDVLLVLLVIFMIIRTSEAVSLWSGRGCEAGWKRFSDPRLIVRPSFAVMAP